MSRLILSHKEMIFAAYLVVYLTCLIKTHLFSKYNNTYDILYLYDTNTMYKVIEAHFCFITVTILESKELDNYICKLSNLISETCLYKSKNNWMKNLRNIFNVNFKILN
jgi:hypothetical protein